MTDLDTFFEPTQIIKTEPEISDDEIKKMEKISNYAQNLQKEEYIEIFKIIKKHNEKFTQNNNGVFITLNKLSQTTMTEIINFIDFCIDNHQRLEKDNNQRNAVMEIMKQPEDNSEDEVKE